MQTAMASLLLVVSTIVLACIVVEYSIAVVEQTLQTTNIPYIDKIRKIESSILNYTDNLLNQTQPELLDAMQP